MCPDAVVPKVENIWTKTDAQWLNQFVAITPTAEQIREARRILAAQLPVTPLVPAKQIARKNSEVYFKVETELPTRSFKPRGALYALAKNLERGEIREVTASSTGNHGAAVAWAAKALGVTATIFLPANPNPVKRRNVADLGAQIIEVGGSDLADAYLEAKEYSSKTGIYFLNDATDPDLPAGPATIGMEILEQLPEVEAIYVPMGDTALIRGVGAAAKQIKPTVRIVGVQAERAPSYYLSWKAGRAVTTETCDTCADGLATRTPELANVKAIRELVDEIVLISEQEMIGAIRELYDKEKIVAEPAGAATTAALLKGPCPDGPIALLVTGANISESVRREAGLPKAI
jgi:threonine dehydratase